MEGIEEDIDITNMASILMRAMSMTEASDFLRCDGVDDSPKRMLWSTQ
jgi:hypothetical protein